MRKVAMFGGSFNPVHKGHVELMYKMKQEFSLDKIYIIPTFSTPLKDNTPMLTPEHRLNMCRLAFEESEDIIVSDLEISRQGRSYTYETLDELSSIEKDSELFLIVGADSFMQLPLWKNAQHIFDMATILSVSRGEYTNSELSHKAKEYTERYGAKVYFLQEAVSTVSSTQVRNYIDLGEDFCHLLPEKVGKYIKENGLYGYGN